MIQEHIKQVREGTIDIVEYVTNALKEAKKIDKEFNYFTTFCDSLALEQAKALGKKPKGRLAGVLISVKDCICVEGVESRAGSSILNGYIPPYQSTVVEKLLKEGAIIIGKTSQDAFGFGGMNLNVGQGFKVPKNPIDATRVCGGSSGGGAGFTQKFDYAHLGLVESTGGSIVDPASFCGVYGLSPTYGLVSRYGLIDYANSLDKIGLMAKDVKGIKLGLSVIEGHDSKDQTSVKMPRSKDDSIKTIGILKSGFNIEEDVKEIFEFFVDKLKYKIKEIELPITSKYALPSYYTIALAEASTNLARYCGMRYGSENVVKGDYNSYFSSVRTEQFSKEEKRRLLVGTFVRNAGYREAYYLKAQKVRTKIIREYEEIFNSVDVIISPTMPLVAPTFSEAKNLSSLQEFMMDQLTVGPNLAGLPHMNIPAGFVGKLPVGVLAITNHLNEGKLLKLAEGFSNG